LRRHERPRARAADGAGRIGETGVDEASPHLPHPAPIEAYGKGGFRFAEMSHRGSLLCLPGGIWASSVTAPGEIDAAALARALAPDAAIDHFLIGTGRDPFPLPPVLREAFRARRVALEAMTTGAAVRTYNILLGERRRIGALLIAVE
jgi:uncharacterized protein